MIGHMSSNVLVTFTGTKLVKENESKEKSVEFSEYR
jgi:hypothetical protein